MNSKRWFIRFTMVFVVALLVVAMVNVSYAQGPGGNGKGRGRGDGRMMVGAMLVQEIAGTTDTLPMDVLQARQDGQSFNDYVTEHGANPDDIVAEVLADVKLMLDRAVENGRLTQEEADERYATAETEIAEAMASTDPLDLPGNREGRIEWLGIISDAVGLEASEILSQVRDGATLAEIVTANGGDVEAVKAEIIAQATERINAGVADGSITQERADEMLANLESHVDDLMNGELRGQFGGRDGGRVGELGLELMDIVSEATGLEPREILSQVRDGATLAEVITANGGDVEAVKAQIITSATERINTAVTDGKITQERADEMLANLETRVDELLNGEFRGQFGEGGRGGRPGGRGNGNGNNDSDTGDSVES